MNDAGHWLFDLSIANGHAVPDGLIAVDVGIDPNATPEQVLILEKAREYGAQFVFFQARQDGRSGVPQAFVFIADGHTDTEAFATLHQRLWSWGGVPLLYRATPGRVDLFRCAHQPDFLRPDGSVFYNPIDTLELAADIAGASAWWSATRLRNGTLWDEPDVCDHLLSGAKAAHKSLVIAIKALAKRLNERNVLNAKLRRRLLIISLLVAYLDERDALEANLFGRFKPDAQRFFEVLAHGPALVELLEDLHGRFNGQVFHLADGDKDVLRSSGELDQFAELIEGYTEPNRQLSFWRLYSFRDLPVELISHIYQLFVDDPSSSIYTPPALVRLMIEEALSFERLDKLAATGEVILDPACGSGIFLVEAYKRLVLHWRSRNGWTKPDAEVLKHLMMQVHGIDLEDDAVELANFSLCLALCDALEPQTIRASLKLFPELSGNSLHGSCFFEALENDKLTGKVGIILGNPPFISKLTTAASARAYEIYKDEFGPIPDFQLAYLFLHNAMMLLQPGGILCMLQQYGFLYNQKTLSFRKRFFEIWNVREILDFISIRNLFQKGGGDTKVIVLLASATPPQPKQSLLHAVFRRTGRASANQGFDIDHYDLHWVDVETVRQDDAVWRANLFGGGRALAFVNRLKGYRTLATYASERQWRFGEGFAEGQRGVDKPASHIHGHPWLPSTALTLDGVDRNAIEIYGTDPIEGPRSQELFTPPMLLIREQMDLPHAVWTEDYLTYKNQIVGFAAPDHDEPQLRDVEQWMIQEAEVIKAYVAGVSSKLFTQKATSLTTADILAIPYPEERSLDCSPNERLVAQDMVVYYRDLIRRGDEAAILQGDAKDNLKNFNLVFTRQINQIYADNPIRPLTACRWQGVLCQPFAFGEGEVDWQGSEALQGRLNALLHEQRGSALTVTRIARVYDERFIFLIKPDRKRYWLSSTALRDADETVADLRLQGF